MENKRKALGKGLEQLFSNERIDFDDFEKDIVTSTKEKDIQNINLNEIRSNPYQPRKHFDENALNELAQSIKEHGVVQPIIVKKSIKGYELIAGERRTKASRIAGMETIPAIVRDFTDEEMMEIALIENIQRENLNVLEEAIAFDKIIKSSGVTQEELARKFGKSRSYLTNILGVLRLPDSIRTLINENKISMGHARCLSKIEDLEEMERLAQRVTDEDLSVRSLENLISATSLPRIARPKRLTSTNQRYGIYENILRDKVGTKVRISNLKIEIPFDSEKDLERILEILNIEIEGE